MPHVCSTYFQQTFNARLLKSGCDAHSDGVFGARDFPPPRSPCGLLAACLRYTGSQKLRLFRTIGLRSWIPSPETWGRYFGDICKGIHNCDIPLPPLFSYCDWSYEIGKLICAKILLEYHQGCDEIVQVSNVRLGLNLDTPPL